ncbi:dedicator of cytokinesis protein 1-like isoform X3 [Apostichopus japonicus]|uniref:dedicator of cytokinesis protein 1-like isoform X3 n=1 Tax=Stichopus japonicus TaxID=307972 RepID=UPI003AB6EB6B
MTAWVPVSVNKYAVAIFNLEPSLPHQIPLSVGDTLHLEEESSGWYKGFNVKQKTQKGIFPKSYVHVKETVQTSQGDEKIPAKETPVVQEITTVLREWCDISKQLYTAGEKEKVELTHKLMYDLIEWRKQILSETLPVDELKDIKQIVTSKVDWGNRKLGLDLVIRDEEGSIQNPNLLSTVALYNKHETAMQRIGQQDKQSDGLRQQKKTIVSYTYNLFVFVKNIVCKIGEDADVLMTLYDAKEGNYISEYYVVKWTSKGTPKDLSLFNNLKVLFTDLGAKDLQREKIYLVCQIIRIGRMELKEGEQKDNNKKYTVGLKRPCGVAVMEITDIVSGQADTDVEKHYFIPFQPCSSDDCLDSVVKKVLVGKEVNHKGQGIWVALKMIPGEAKQVFKEYPHLVDTKTAIARKMGFPEVIMPGDVRNDVYITLVQGDFDRGTRPKTRNVEVAVSVCNGKGNIIPNAIYHASGEKPGDVYHSVVYYQVKAPKYQETFKVAIPIEEFCQPNTHVRLTFRHRSSTEAKDKQEKPFGLSYLRLMTDIGTTVPNGNHDLLVFKGDKSQDQSTGYLELPNTKQDLESGNHSSQNTKKGFYINSNHAFQISTVVCSTKLTQNVDLLGLLKWRSDQDHIRESLESLMKVDGEEVVKFLQDTLDALCGIMAENPQSEAYDEPVFNALVFIIGLIADRKYQQFRPVLDTYIREHYSITFADRKMMKILKTYLDNSSDISEEESTAHEPLYKALKSAEYLFKFVLRSRVLFVDLHGESTGKQHFETSVREVFHSLSWLMTITSDTILTCQGAAMRYIPTVISDTMFLFSRKELAELLKEFIIKLPPDRLVRPKLECIRDFVHSDIFRWRECRTILLPMMAEQLESHMSKSEEMSMCADVLTDILDVLWQKEVGTTHGDISQLMHTLLQTVIQSAIQSNSDDNQLLGKYVACMISLLRQMTEYHYQEYLNAFSSRMELIDFLMKIFLVFRNLVSKNVYPNDWSVMIMQVNSVVLFAMKQFARVLARSFVTIDDFEYQLWNNIFHLAVAFVTQESLQLEQFSPGKRNSILETYKDMRREVAFDIIRTMWNYLGKNKIKFIPGMVGPFLEVTLVPEEELRKETIPIFFDMMQCEYNINKSFKTFECEIITKLDSLVECGGGDEEYKVLFKSIIADYCQKHQILHRDGLHFVSLITKLLERLLDYRNIIHEENRENKMSCTVNLLNFYKEIDRQDMYIRYLYKLRDLHLECENYIEAAYSLQLRANRLKWSDTPLLTTNQQCPDAKTERQLKEVLYYEIVELFDKGKLWEKGIILCKELAEQYEKETFDYIQLGELLTQQALLYNNIMKVPRPAPEYFKVSFIGLGFPTFLRNKTFIYRGKDYERLTDFVARMQQLYPSAHLMNKTTTPDKELFESKGQTLQIVPVQPVREERKEFRGKMISEQIMNYYSVNEVQKFTYSRPFHKEQKDKENEFKTMWVERTYYIISEKLPGTLRWFEVITSTTEELSPIQTAIENMEDINRKLKNIIIQHQEEPALQVNPLSGLLNSVIDSAVMGGPVIYEQAFCSNEYAQTHSGDQIHISRLKELFAEQIPLVEVGLGIHRRKATEMLKPLQNKMEEMFQRRKSLVEEKYGKKLVEAFSLSAHDKLVQSFARRRSRGNTISGRPISTMSSSSSSSDTPGTGSRSSVISVTDSVSPTSREPPVRRHSLFPYVQSDETNTLYKRSWPSLSSRSSGSQLKEKAAGSPVKTPSNKAHRNSKDMSNEDVSSITNSTPAKESHKPIILDEKLSSARPLRKDIKKANHSPINMQRPMRALTLQGMTASTSTPPSSSSSATSTPTDLDPDIPPKLPPKQSNLEMAVPQGDAGSPDLDPVPPPKPAGYPILRINQDDEPPPLPKKGNPHKRRSSLERKNSDDTSPKP